MLFVGRQHLRCRTATSSTASATATPAAASARGSAIDCGAALRALHVALPTSARLDGNRLAVRRVLDILKRKRIRRISAARSAGKRRRDLRVIERRRARGLCRIDQHELAAGGRGYAIPKAFVGQPVGAHARVGDQRGRVVSHEFFGARILGRGELRLREGRGKREQGYSETTRSGLHLRRIITLGRIESQVGQASWPVVDGRSARETLMKQAPAP